MALHINMICFLAQIHRLIEIKEDLVVFAQIWFNYNIDYLFNLSSFLPSLGWEGVFG